MLRSDVRLDHDHLNDDYFDHVHYIYDHHHHDLVHHHDYHNDHNDHHNDVDDHNCRVMHRLLVQRCIDDRRHVYLLTAALSVRG
jgi:DNA polymerase II large subunit